MSESPSGMLNLPLSCFSVSPMCSDTGFSVVHTGENKSGHGQFLLDRSKFYIVLGSGITHVRTIDSYFRVSFHLQGCDSLITGEQKAKCKNHLIMSYKDHFNEFLSTNLFFSFSSQEDNSSG